MIGWGCNFKVLLDYDNAGYGEYEKLVSKFGEELMKKRIAFVNAAVEATREDVKSNPVEIEDIIGRDDISEVHENSKPIIAKRFLEQVSNNEITLSKTTVENFTKIFKTLKILED